MTDDTNPFAYSSEGEEPVQTSTGVLNLAAFEHPSSRMTAVNVLFALFFLVQAISVGSSLMQIELLSEAASGNAGADYEERANTNDQRELAVAGIHTLSYLLLAIVSLMLLYRLRSNVDHFGATGLDSTAGWSVGWFFVPVFNLWRPMQATRQTWAASANPQQWKTHPIPGIISAWWIFWVLASIIERVANATIMQPQSVTIDDLIRSTWLAIATVGVTCVAGLLYVLMLNGLTRTQVATYDSLLGQQSGNGNDSFGPQF